MVAAENLARFMALDLKALVTARMGENYDLHHRHVNPTLVQVQRTIGFDKVYTRAEGAWLFDAKGNDYLDFLSGYSAFNVGRNHPVVKQAILDVLEMDLPNMVQLDCSLLSGLLAEELLRWMPEHLDAVFFTNSGTESVEAALKFAKAATGRPGLVSLKGSFHGLSYGSLSLMQGSTFQEGFEPFLPQIETVGIGDVEGLATLLRSQNFAALVIEPVQGKGVNYPVDDFFRQAQTLCRETGTLLICDEVQTGLGRTGKWLGCEHWNLEPDIVTLAKSLSGGFVPCGAIVTRRTIYREVFSRLDRCIVHSTTFGRNNLAMACGLATLQILKDEGLIANAAKMGDLLMDRVRELQKKHSIIKEVRGLGLMIAIEFQAPSSFAGRLSWNLLHKADPALYAQMIATGLLSQYRVLSQVAAHGMDVLKILPPLMIGEREVDRFVTALDGVLKSCEGFPTPVFGLGKNFFTEALRSKRHRPVKSSPPAPASGR